MASAHGRGTMSADAVRGSRVPKTLMMIMLLLGGARGQQQCEDTCSAGGGAQANDGYCNDEGYDGYNNDHSNNYLYYC